MGFSKISADADFGGGVWHIIPSGEHREWAPLAIATRSSYSRSIRAPIHQISGAGWFKKKQLFRVYFCVVHELSPFIFSNFLANLNLKNATAVCGIPFLQHTKDSPAINASWFLRTWEVGKNGRMQVATRADSNKKDSDKKQLASSSKRKQEQRGKCAFLSWRMSTWTFQY